MTEPNMDDLDFLEKSCSGFVLRYLLEHPGSNTSQIMSAGGKNLSTKHRRVEDLTNLGLIVPEWNGREVNYELSDYGRSIALLLNAISDLMKEFRSGFDESGSVWVSPHYDELVELLQERRLENDEMNLDE